MKLSFGWVGCALVWLAGAGAAELLPPGHRPAPPGVHALTGAKVVVKPGEVLDEATIVIRDGLIVAVGKEVKPPPDARVWDLKGASVYAGFIEPYLVQAATNPPAPSAGGESPGPTSGIYRYFGTPGQEPDPGNPGPGHSLGWITPERRAAQSYAPEPRVNEGLRELGFTVAHLVPGRGIIRGVTAVVTLADGDPNDVMVKPEVFQAVSLEAPRASQGGFPRSLMGATAALRQALMDAQHYGLDQADFARRPAARKRPPFNPALEALRPVVERKLPVLIEPGSALMVERAAQLGREFNFEFALVSSGQEWRRPELAKAANVTFIVPVGFPEPVKPPEEDDWSQVSLDQLRAWDWAPENSALLRQRGLEVALTTYGLSDRRSFRRKLRAALERGLSEQDALAALTTIPAKLCGLSDRFGAIEAGKNANLTVVAGASYFEPEAKVREVWIDGRVHRVVPAEERQPRPAGDQKPKPAKPETAQDGKAKKDAELKELRRQRVARSPREGRAPLAEPAGVLIQNATIWTCGPSGRLENADLLIVGDKVRSAGPHAQLRPESSGGVLTIDGRGLHVTPGIVDPHNHSMILGGVNEGSLPCSAMVRIGDVVNSESPTIYQQLAGGVTTVNLLHGSANPIGGQNCVIKLREGAAPDQLKFAAAPPSLKFALGENVKQSNAGERGGARFPQSRTGVRAFIANRFTAARQYLKEWDDYQKASQAGAATNQAAPLPPRRDLELEALGEVLQGKRWIHCHAYRQDEIVAFLRLLEEFGVKAATLDHVLEGYKVADEMARHGVGASALSDWWAYKFEVYDAIPYAGSLMRQRGVLVAYHSDSSDFARRLYLEAAKAVKYGRTPEDEALKFVTFNPAKQLHLDHRIGSLEPGKDADFAIWSRAPLDSATVCLQTWIEGKKYFDRDLEAGRVEALEKERAALIEKAKKLAGGD